MSLDTERIGIECDETPCEEAIADCEKQLDQVETERQKTEQATSGSLRHMARGIFGIISITQSIFDMIGVSLDPMGQAIIGMVTSTISALQAIAVSMVSNPVTAPFAAITAGAAIVLGAYTLGTTIMGVNRSKDEIKKAQAMLRLLHSGMALTRTGGW